MPDVLQKTGPMTGTGGMVRPQPLPKEWEKQTLPMTKEAPQGPEVTSKPTSRSLAPIPGQVQSCFDQGDPGGFIQDVLAGRPSAATRTASGDNTNVQTGGQGEERLASGSATRTTGTPVKGQVLGKGAF